ncbi:diol dehydratase small subunit [Dactylosporangium matsuzakiense]|uniref:Glycerol dehydrogenase n=1 Tax=Dactylosporangium matsuzakiense TaxID=53360 RepID=A0A9W6KLN9_9ACTN|nr:diol dehydratase small subunit [Dactylosporangium matsuzakiense]GLL02839.1 glycerol dehydrogenase [Dactylosporangium matsuzakiense]
MRSFSGRSIVELTVGSLHRGELTPDDVRIHPDTLRHQASVAAAHGNPQLADNLLRAAELTAFAEDEILALYEALRPHRSTAAQLSGLATSLESRAAPRCAALVREAAAVYARRGLLKP